MDIIERLIAWMEWNQRPCEERDLLNDALEELESTTARLAEAEAERDVERNDRTAAEFEMLALRDRLSESEAEIKRLNQVLNNSLAGIEDAYSGGSEQAAKGGREP